MNVKPEYYKVIKSYQSPYPDPIIFKRNDSVKVGRKSEDDPDWQNWIWCEGDQNRKAWVPEQYITIDGVNGTFIRDYNAMELDVSPGETLAVFEKINGFGMAEKSNEKRGWVPLKNLQRAEDD